MENKDTISNDKSFTKKTYFLCKSLSKNDIDHLKNEGLEVIAISRPSLHFIEEKGWLIYNTK